jgi:hypothetical protein
MVVVIKLSEGQQLVPVILAVTCEVLQVFLKLLVDALHLAICLQIISS